MQAPVKRTTIKDVAREARVATTTVSRYLNNAKNIDPEIAKRIEQAIVATNYHPNLLARSLKMQRSQIISLIVPDICNPFYSLMAKTAQRCVSKRNCFLSLYDTDGDSSKENAALDLALQQNCCGILFASLDFKASLLYSANFADTPLVGLNAYSQKFPYDLVHVMPKGGTYLAMKHLLSLGHRLIAFAGGTPESIIAVNRRDGYLTALEEAGIPANPHFIFEMGFSQQDGYRAGRYFSSFSPLPTAICCANDQIALGVIEALQSLGLSVPEDISVTGVDNIPYSCISKPSLTTVTNDGAKFAELGTKLLFERIDGIYSGEKRKAVVPNTLIERNSTSAPVQNTGETN